MRQLKIILMVLVAVAIAAFAYVSLIIERQHLAIAQISNNNTVFIGSQSVAELLRFRGQLRDYASTPTDASDQQIRLRFDILLNRLATISNGEFGAFMRASPRRDLLLGSYAKAIAEVGGVMAEGLSPASAPG